jgi:hypothetical protein
MLQTIVETIVMILPVGVSVFGAMMFSADIIPAGRKRRFGRRPVLR